MATSFNHCPSFRANLKPKTLRGYRLCDQCGAAESPTEKFRLCGACLTTQYCSQSCQRLHWPSHKPICRHTVAQIHQVSKDEEEQKASMGTRNLVKDLRRFASAYSTLLGWAGFQALQLRTLPQNVSEAALLLVLQYRPHLPTRFRFSVLSTHIVPRTFISDTLVNNEILRRDERCKLNAGIGAMLVIIQCESTSEVMPVEVDALQDIDWATCEDWETVLAGFISTGQTYFQPVRVPR